MININVLPNLWTILGVFASFFVAVVALGVAIYSNCQTRKLHKAEKKERVLNEIVEWANDINVETLKLRIPEVDKNFELSMLELIKTDPTSAEKFRKIIGDTEFKFIRMENAIRRNIHFSKLRYISSLVEKVLNKELSIKRENKNILELIKDITRYNSIVLYIVNKEINIDIRPGFSGFDSEFNKIDKEIEASDIRNVHFTYSTLLSSSIDNLFEISTDILDVIY